MFRIITYSSLLIICLLVLLFGCITSQAPSLVVYSIYGKVIEPDETPITGVEVVLKEDVTNGQEIDRTTTDASGAYKFDRLNPRSYSVLFTSRKKDVISVGLRPIVLTPSKHKHQHDIILTPNIRGD